MTAAWFILARAVHFGACLLFFGLFAFDRFAAVSIAARLPPETARYWRLLVRWSSLVALPIILLSGMIWFALAAGTMSGEPLQIDVWKIVWTQTQFGTVWQFRLAFWLVAAVAAMLLWFFQSRPATRLALTWVELFFGGCLLGSLAWAGHGQESSRWHLFADSLHLLVAGFWPAGLLPFALLLNKLRRTSEAAQWSLVVLLVRRFSAISLGSVALLVATGLVNSWFLVGSIENLFQQPYGRWLLAKIILFLLAVAIGAVNLLRLKPRLVVGEMPGPTAARLQLNVWLELMLGALIIFVVAILGILPPALFKVVVSFIF
jgi:putative copper resistance protein D